MGGSDEMSRLSGIIEGFEARVKALEARLTGKKATSEEIRMILIGPPGAGMFSTAPPKSASAPACLGPPL